LLCGAVSDERRRAGGRRTALLGLLDLRLEQLVLGAQHALAAHRAVHDELDRLALVEHVLVVLHDLPPVHRARLERAVRRLRRLPRVDVRRELLLVAIARRVLVALVEYVLLLLLVDLALGREVVLRELVAVVPVLELEPLLGELQHLLLARERLALAARDAHPAEQRLVVGDLAAEQLEALLLALLEVLVARALAEVGQRRVARVGVVGELPPARGLVGVAARARRAVLDELLGRGLVALAHARGERVALGEVRQPIALGPRVRVAPVVVVVGRGHVGVGRRARAGGRVRVGAPPLPHLGVVGRRATVIVVVVPLPPGCLALARVPLPLLLRPAALFVDAQPDRVPSAGLFVVEHERVFLRAERRCGVLGGRRLVLRLVLARGAGVDLGDEGMRGGRVR
jgi:hypothetical protein